MKDYVKSRKAINFDLSEHLLKLYYPSYNYKNSWKDIQKYLEDNHYEMVSGEFERIPLDTKELTDEQRETVDKLLEKLEEDDDVTNVYHNIKE